MPSLTSAALATGHEREGLFVSGNSRQPGQPGNAEEKLDTGGPAESPGLPRTAQRDVRLLLFLQVLVSGSNAWVFGALFDADLYLISHSNSMVGIVESAKGITGLLAAVPLGYLSDKWPRVYVLRGLSLFVPLVVVLAVLSLFQENTGVIMLVAAIWAVIGQGCNGAITVMLADLAPPGPVRAKVMGWRVIAQQIGMSGGPLLQLVLIVCAGSQDAWTPRALAATLTAGLVQMVLLIPVAWCISRTASPDCQSTPTASSGIEDVDVLPDWARRALCRGRWQLNWLVVVLLETSFLLTLLISGSAVTFSPLFFKQDLSFQPVAICAMAALSPLFVAAFVPVCVGLAQRMGTVPGIVLGTVLGGGFQLLLGLCPNCWSAVVVYFLRNAFMRSRDPLYQALLMDCLERRYRGRFSSITSVRAVTWAGSAFLGGLLLDSHGSDYRLLFMLSGALMSLVPTMVVLPLLCLVPRTTSP